MSKKYLRTSTLEIEVEDTGSSDSLAIILLHGFPDSAQSWRTITPQLVSKGYRVVAPSLRGFGGTRFLEADTRRNGQTAAFASDVMELVKLLRLEHFLLVGHDIGASAAMIVAPLMIEKLAGLLLLAPNLQAAYEDTVQDFHQARAYWYKWYFCTTQGQNFFRENHRAFCRELWHTWSPSWQFDDAEFEFTADAFMNPDFFDVIMHFYQHTSGETTGDTYYDEIQHQAKAIAHLEIPTVVLHGDEDACTLPSASLGREAYFTKHYQRHILSGIGHFVHRESPSSVVNAIHELLSQSSLN